MTRTATINTNTRGLERGARLVERARRDSEQAAATAGRLLNPLGATSGGGGRGGFKGALKDFIQRDEIIGRTGTISRLALSGNVVGTLLAFQSIEEFFSASVKFLKGDATFADVVRDQFKFLVPSILREQLPEILKVAGVIDDQAKIGKRMARDFQSAVNEPDYWDIDPLTGRRTRAARPPWLKEDAGDWSSARWRNSEDFRRWMTEGSDRGLR